MEVHLDRKPRRLSKQDYLRAQLLGRQLKNYTAEELKAQKELCRAQVVYDDDLKPFSLNGSYKTFFPQTYVSSSFLLSLLDPKQIVAIPQGLRKQTQLFSTDLTKQIKYDINHFNAEKLYLCRPDLAFVAHYSHPSTIQALIEQNIESFNLKYVNSLSEITEALLRVGHLIDMPLEAELMKIFIEAAMYSIDNRFLSLNIDFSSLQNAPKLLFLNHHSQFNIPTKRSLTGHLLQRVGMLEHLVRRFPNQQNDWMIPLDQEQIVNMNPDYLIIATTNVNSSKKQIFNDPVMHQINAVQNDRLCFVDEVVQQSPSQYIVLAYYDLFNAIASLIDP
jgi:iron complex transport system substrate-binding protein